LLKSYKNGLEEVEADAYEEKRTNRNGNDEGNTEEDMEYYNNYENSNTNNINNYSFLKFLKFDLKRKIKASDISWESDEFDINDPYFSSEEENNQKTYKEGEAGEDEDGEVEGAKEQEFGVSEEVYGVIEVAEQQNDNFHLNLNNLNSKEERNLITTFENLNLNLNLNSNNLNYLKSENVRANQANKQIEKIKTNNTILKDKKIKANKKQKQKKETINFSEILAEINRLKSLSSDTMRNHNIYHNLYNNNNSKNEKMNINEELNFSNNCFPYRTMVYCSEILSSENISLMQNFSEINHENNLSATNKKPDLDNIDNSEDRNINLNDYSFSRINSVNHSYNISSFMKRASNQTIETINRNSKNGFYSKTYFKIFLFKTQIIK